MTGELIYDDNIFETSTTQGTGALTLAGNVTGAQTFRTAFGDGPAPVGYVIRSAVEDGEFETGIGTFEFTGGNATLTRTTVISSSNSDAAVNWGAGTRNVWCGPAGKVIAGLLTNNLGTGRPAWLQAGGLWIDSDAGTGGDEWGLYLYDGTDDTLIGTFTFDTSGGTFTPAGLGTAGSLDVGTDPDDVVQFGDDGSGGAQYPAGDGSLITGISAAPIVAASRGLVAKWASASTVDVDADEIVLKDATGAAFLAEAVDLTVDITASGANGLDDGSEASDTWYYLWVIHNPTTDTDAGLISTSSTSPTMPSGYTFKALVGPVRNDGSSDFIEFWQSDRRIAPEPQVVFTGQAGQTSYGSQSLSAFVPPIAKTVTLIGGQTDTSGSGSMAWAGNANGVGEKLAHAGTSGASFDGYGQCGVFPDVPLITAQTAYWKTQNTDADKRAEVTGYTI